MEASPCNSANGSPPYRILSLTDSVYYRILSNSEELESHLCVQSNEFGEQMLQTNNPKLRSVTEKFAASGKIDLVLVGLGVRTLEQSTKMGIFLLDPVKTLDGADVEKKDWLTNYFFGHLADYHLYAIRAARFIGSIFIKPGKNFLNYSDIRKVGSLPAGLGVALSGLEDQEFQFYIGLWVFKKRGALLGLKYSEERGELMGRYRPLYESILYNMLGEIEKSSLLATSAVIGNRSLLRIKVFLEYQQQEPVAICKILGNLVSKNIKAYDELDLQIISQCETSFSEKQNDINTSLAEGDVTNALYMAQYALFTPYPAKNDYSFLEDVLQKFRQAPTEDARKWSATVLYLYITRLRERYYIDKPEMKMRFTEALAEVQPYVAVYAKDLKEKTEMKSPWFLGRLMDKYHFQQVMLTAKEKEVDNQFIDLLKFAKERADRILILGYPVVELFIHTKAVRDVDGVALFLPTKNATFIKSQYVLDDEIHYTTQGRVWAGSLLSKIILACKDTPVTDWAKCVENFNNKHD